MFKQTLLLADAPVSLLKRFLSIKNIKKFVPTGLRNTLRFLKNPKYSFIRLCILLTSKKTILSGPFEGIFFDLPNFNTAMMLGTWEKELHEYFFKLKTHTDIICIGAAEGYYAVGLSRLFPGSEIIAFEAQEKYRKLLVENAKVNKSDNIVVRGFCDCEELKSTLKTIAGSPLIICDIEGHEIDLLDLDNVPELSKATILVETHEMYVKNCENLLIERFCCTHNYYVYHGKKRSILDLPNKCNYLKYIASKKEMLSLMSEGRPYPMNWVLLKPKD